MCFDVFNLSALTFNALAFNALTFNALALLSRYDLNGDGSISVSELSKILDVRVMGIAMPCSPLWFDQLSFAKPIVD